MAVLLLDRVGRRPLLISGTVGLGVALLALAAYFAIASLRASAPWLALGGLLLYIASFAIGLGPVFWLMISEIFPQRLRSRAMSVATLANWAANFAVSATFLTLVEILGRPGVFVLYTVIAAVAVVFFWRRVPETKNRTLEEIQRELAARHQPATGGSGIHDALGTSGVSEASTEKCTSTSCSPDGSRRALSA